MSNEITKDNITEVLEFNNIDPHRYKIDDDTIACFTDVNGKWIGTTILYGCPEWLKIVELYFGELAPLPNNPFDMVKIGQWTRNINNNTWYERLAGDNINYRQGYSYCYCTSTTPEDWDLTDIRDYNPTECVLKVGDEFCSGGGPLRLIMRFDYVNERVHYMSSSIRFNVFSALIDPIEVNGKKYDRITIPPFDFEQALLNNGFTRSETTGGYKLIKNGVRCDFGYTGIYYSGYKYSLIEPTPSNAERLIKAAAMLNELELT